MHIVYNDKKSDFMQLLEKDCSVSIHTRNLQVLATEIYKAKNNLCPSLVQNLFKVTEPQYNFRRHTVFNSRNIRTQRYGLDSLTYLGPKIWDQVPVDIKESVSLAIFKDKIKNWIPIRCPCRLCRNYVANVGFI